MGWQTPLTGEVRMSAEAARQLLALGPVDWRDDGQTFGEYLAGGTAFDEARGALRFDLGWVTWRLTSMMRLIAAMKDLASTDALVHHAPTYDAWYETGTFFVAPGRWGYVGARPMFDVAKGARTSRSTPCATAPSAARSGTCRATCAGPTTCS